MTASFPIAFGRYALVERLAIGGMAELFLAEVKGDHGFAKKVVIKRILPHLASDAHFTQMFISEAKITARLSHPRIAQTHRLGREGTDLFIEMEYVDGLDVLAVLRECAHRRVRLPPEVSAYIIKETLDGLDYAHRLKDDRGEPLGIVHRDVSPSNVLISRRGNIKLVDFGIAHAAAMEQHTQAGTLKGKYGYMSPEQVLGEGVSPQSDLFSVGVVLAEMLMGRRLFAAPNELDVLLMVRDVNLGRLERYGSHVPPELDVLVRRALKKDQAERYASAAEFRDALDEWMFEKRHRVTPAMVGEMVESLYEDAHQRRRSGLEDMPMVVPAEAASPAAIAAAAERSGAIHVHDPARAATMPPPMRPPGAVGTPLPPALARAAMAAAASSAGAAGQGGPRDSEVPGGLALSGGDSLSEEEIESAFADALKGVDEDGQPLSEERLTARLKAVRRAEKAIPAPGADDELHLSEEIVVDLEGIDSRPRLVPPQVDGEEVDRTVESNLPQMTPPRGFEPGTARALPATGSVSFGPAGGGAAGGYNASGGYNPSGGYNIDVDEDGIPISVDDPEHSIRFPTISAAVASVSPPARDPASRDFDDSDISGVAEPAQDARSGKIRLPTADEIARAPKPKPPALEEIHETPAQAGDLAVTSPIHVLFQLVASRADGMLVVTLGGIRKEIYIKDGMPTYVSSNVASELFGAYLVSEAAISSGELDMALAMMPHFSGKLGDTLVGLGLMKPLDVFRLLTRQVRHKLIDVSTWNKGTYQWFPWRENHRESFPLDLDPYEVLGAGAMALDEEMMLRWHDKVAERRPRRVDRANVRPEQFKVGIGRDVFDDLNGERSVAELVARRAKQEERMQFLRVLFLFCETGLVSDLTG